jgi:hypothetical protein
MKIFSVTVLILRTHSLSFTIGTDASRTRNGIGPPGKKKATIFGRFCTSFWRQNFGGVKILAASKFWRRQYFGDFVQVFGDFVKAFFDDFVEFWGDTILAILWKEVPKFLRQIFEILWKKEFFFGTQFWRLSGKKVLRFMSQSLHFVAKSPG